MEGAVSPQSESGESRALEPVNGEYQIYTADDLKEFAELVNGGKTDADAKLMNDIDLSEICSEEEGTWTPIGTNSNEYTGTFDGNGKTIENLYINNTDSGADNQGLFGYVGSGGIVQNLTVTGSVTSSVSPVGGVVGWNGGTVENCHNIGEVSGNYVGGVVGYNSGTVKNCRNIGEVSGNQVGGVVGDNGGTVENCYNTGTVSGPDIGHSNAVGGVVGLNSSGDSSASVTNCYNTGTVTGPDNVNGETTVNVGGVVGSNSFSATVTNCYNTGTVTGPVSASGNNSVRVGGVVGNNSFSASVTNCYNTGEVSGLDSGSDSNVGGVVGQNFSASVTNCYNTGEVSGNQVGGVVGQNFGGTVENCYNIGEVSGNQVGGVVGYNFSSGGSGNVTDCYFLKQNPEIPGIGGGNDSADATPVDDLDALCNALASDTTTWTISENLSRPVLTSNHEDDGTKDHPYEIFTATQLENFRDLVNDENGNPNAHAKLMNNIDLSSVCGESNSWTPIGNSIGNSYEGTFNGDGKTISGLYIDSSDVDYKGLFGRVNGGTVQDLSVSGDINGNRYVGGVVGYNNGGTVTGCAFSGSVSGKISVGGVVGENSGSNGVVENCHNAGKVSGSNTVGGVVGRNYSNGTVTNCTNTGNVSGPDSVNGSADSSNVGGVVGDNRGSVSGDWYVGGVVGWNDSGTVKNCYNIGDVSGKISVGGVVGWNRSSVTNCYNTGSVSDGTYTGGVVGYNDGDSVTNCYFLQGTAESGIGENDVSGDATATEKDRATFHSGEVAWLLENGQAEDQTTPVWGQSDLTTPDSWPTLVALDKNENAKPVYKVVFISDNTEIEAQYANNGMTVGSPTTNPTKEGYTFAGWFTEDSGGSQWNFSTAVTENMTLYAQWTPVEEPDPTPTPTPDPTPSGPSTGDSSGWDDIRDELENTENGDEITIDMGDETKVPAEIFESVAGKDVDVTFDLGDIQWSVNGADIPTDTDFTDLDLGASLGTSGIPVNVINTITGEVGTVQITLAHDGEFGFTMTLTAPLGKENAGYWANLYHYDESAEALNFEAAAKIDEDGSVTIPFSHASQYAIVIDTHSHATVDVSDLFIDIAPDAWYKDAVQYAYDNGLMTGVSATEFAPEQTTTRAMIVSILARLENVTSAEAAGFADVNDEWYATAVNWAANVGVVNGYEDNTFRPNTAITREQLAAILMNYAACIGQDVSARASLDNYTDQPSTWAEEAMSWAVAEGLISGVTADTLQPQGAATRAQVAAILERFLAQ